MGHVGDYQMDRFCLVCFVKSTEEFELFLLGFPKKYAVKHLLAQFTIVLCILKDTMVQV
jgi:hypothetical protein